MGSARIAGNLVWAQFEIGNLDPTSCWQDDTRIPSGNFWIIQNFLDKKMIQFLPREEDAKAIEPFGRSLALRPQVRDLRDFFNRGAA